MDFLTEVAGRISFEVSFFSQSKFEKGEIPGGQVHKVARHLAVVWGGRFVVSSFPDKCDRPADTASRALEAVEFHSAG